MGGIILIVYHEDSQKVVTELGSDIANGLTDAQVLKKREQHGENKLQEKKKKTNF